MMTTSSRDILLTSTKFTARISSPTFKQPLLYTADSSAIRDMKTPSERAPPSPSLMYNPRVWPGRLTISTSWTIWRESCKQG